MFDAVYRDVITEDWIDDVVELVRIVDFCVKCKLLAFWSLGLYVVLPEMTFLALASRAAQARKLFLVNPQV